MAVYVQVATLQSNMCMKNHKSEALVSFEGEIFILPSFDHSADCPRPRSRPGYAHRPMLVLGALDNHAMDPMEG